jgi:transposase
MKTFKDYCQNQPVLLPENISDFIDDDDMVRVIDAVINQIDLTELKNMYLGGGRASYNPVMLLKVLIYAYCQKIYSSRQIEDKLKSDIRFMWLSARQRVDHTTIARFRSKKIAGIFENIFAKVVDLLAQNNYLDLSTYFLDGTKVEANANKYSYVWKTSTKKYQQSLKENVHKHLIEIDELNNQEDKKYADIEVQKIDTKKISKLADEISSTIKPNDTSKTNRRKKTIVKKLKTDFLPREKKYEKQLEILENRNSYSKTDIDATFMRMKEDQNKPKADPKPAYNMQIGTNEQFVISYSLSQSPNDLNTLIPDLDKLSKNHELPKTVVADAGYGSEENYKFLEDNKITPCVKYQTYYREMKGTLSQFDRKMMEYDKSRDEYTCPNNRKLVKTGTSFEISTTGYKRHTTSYECEDCSGCEFAINCIKKFNPNKPTNRTMSVSKKGKRLEEKAKKVLLSEKGKKLKRQRNIEPETVFGDLKQNFHLKRFMLRGKEKVEVEFGLFSMAHNLNKLTKSLKNDKKQGKELKLLA